MTTYQQIVVVGRLGAAPVLRMSPAGSPCATFSVATDEASSGDGSPQATTEWHDVIVWGAMARAVVAQLAIGDLVQVVGRIRSSKWTDRERRSHSEKRIHASTVAKVLSQSAATSQVTARAPAPQHPLVPVPHA